MEDINVSIRIVRILKQVMDAIKQSIGEEFEDMRLTGTQGMLIGTLSHHGPMKISQLSERMGLSNSTVSGIIDRLEKQGVVERTRSEEDRRVVYVNITVEFKKTAKKHFTAFENKLESMLSEATPEEVEKISEGFTILKALLDKQAK